MSHSEQDAALYAPTMLDQLTQPISNISAYVEQYVNDPDTSTGLLNAATYLDAAALYMAQMPALPPGGRAGAAGRAASKYEAATHKSLAEVTRRANTLDAQLTALVETVEALKAESAEQVADKIDEVGDSLLEKSQAAWQEPISAATAAKVAAEAELAEMRTLNVEAKNIAATLAEKAVAKDYRKNALNKSVGGWIWDVIGTLVGAGALALIGYHLLNVSAETSIPLAVTRLAVSIAGLGLAALCFARARGFHHESRISKRTQIRIDTVAGFVANLDDDTKEAVIEGMAERLYMRGELDPVAGDDPSFATLKALRERIRARRTEPVGEDV